MQIDLQDKAKELLTSLANSMYNRKLPVFFSVEEIDLADEWLQVFLKEMIEKAASLEIQPLGTLK